MLVARGTVGAVMMRCITSATICMMMRGVWTYVMSVIGIIMRDVLTHVLVL